MLGITSTLGPNTSRVTFSIGPMIDGVSADGAARLMAGARETVIAVSPIAFIRPARTSTGSCPGAMRQFTLADAVCGSAFRAWPPESIVATHVVRNIER